MAFERGADVLEHVIDTLLTDESNQSLNAIQMHDAQRGRQLLLLKVSREFKEHMLLVGQFSD